MSRSVTGADSFEVEVTLAGTFQPGCREQGPTYASGGQPAEPDMIEDLEVTGIFGLRLVRAKAGDALSHDRVWEKVDLLANVDQKSAAYRQIMANILAFMDVEEAEQAIIRDMEEVF